MGIFDKAKTKVQSWHKLEIVPKNIRDSTMGNIINLTMTEHCAYRIVSQDVEVGALPGYTLFLLIPLVAMIEALLAPWVAWLGYKTRRKMILTWSLGIIGISSAWLFLPSPINLEQTEICNSTNSNTEIMYTELSMRTSIRVMLTIGMAISFCLARVATWSHVIAYTDDIAPERMSVHVGILIIARVLGLLFHNFLSQAADQNILVALVIITVFTTLNTLRLYFEIPKVIQDTGALKAIPMNDRGYFKSLKRVLFNFVAVSQMIAMGLLAAALWGFGYNQEEIIKMRSTVEGIFTSVCSGYHDDVCFTV
ncbi:uncharacterized protein LOC119839084 [Zerene cesonia]|uniref:uncharacterized protein LOC119839084 n=1 Tax=Zerene cesonia TaxID=33412 RepID=UPI0018E53280|nr:uncharacterized protein LOC119839084 [Zerene cesonia]